MNKEEKDFLPDKMVLFQVFCGILAEKILTNAGTSYNAMVDGWAAIFADLETVVFVMWNGTSDVGGEFEGEMSGIGSFSAFDEHDGRFALPFEYN